LRVTTGGDDPVNDDLTVGWEMAKFTGVWDPSRGLKAKVNLDDASVASAGYGVALQGIAAISNIAGATISAKVASARLTDNATPRRFAPLKLRGGVNLRFGVVDGELYAGVAGQDDWPVRFNVRHDLEHGAGNGSLRDLKLQFAPGGLQPGHVVAALSQVEDLSGTLEAGAQATWTAGSVDGVGQVQASNVGFTMPDGKVEGLELKLLLKDFMPFETAPGQLLSIRKIDTAVPLQNLEMRFHLSSKPDRPFLPTLTIEKADVDVLGGRVGLEPVVVEPGTSIEDLEVALRPRNFDLAELLKLISVDGLTGSGSIGGRIPVSMSGGGVAIHEGVLSASGDGVIRYQSEQAKKVLAGQGEQMELMLRALENFQYTRLSITINKAPAGEAQLLLRMLGSNPEVLEGHPFQFNINVTGNVDRLIEPVLQIYRGSAGLMGRLGGVQQ
jgi:hypothetical protein